jgi:hypothetical protein
MGKPINVTIDRLAEPPETEENWDSGWNRARSEERDYVRRLKGKDLLDYLEQRKEEAFLENI